MVEIQSPEALRLWLNSRHSSWSKVIAQRAALRVLPNAFLGNDAFQGKSNYMLSLFRASLISWGALTIESNVLTASSDRASQSSAYSANSFSHFSNNMSGISSIKLNQARFNAINAASKAAKVASRWYDNHLIAADAVSSAYSAADDKSEFWQAISDDCQWLVEHGDNYIAHRALAYKSLWLNNLNKLDVFEKNRENFSTQFGADDLIIDWFIGRVQGRLSVFNGIDQPSHKSNEWLLKQVGARKNKEFWDRGASYVFQQIRELIAQLNEGVIFQDNRSSSDFSISKRLLESASPQARVVDGILDAVPNAVFDAPKYSENLADLPSEMQAFLAVLGHSLPRNCPIIIRNCIEGYSDELQVRGNRPIVNILTGMASAIAAEFWIIGENGDQQNPETWQVRHPQEWDIGTADLLRTFFKKHIDLITHFPLNTERESLILSTPIDEVKASGSTLLDPIRAIHDLIAKLNTDGLATDNIVKIIDALARYGRDISGLPLADQSARGNDIVTPKRRFVLNFLGFCLQAYSVIGTTFGLADSKTAAAFLVALGVAIRTFTGFIL